MADDFLPGSGILQFPQDRRCHHGQGNEQRGEEFVTGNGKTGHKGDLGAISSARRV